MQSETLHQPGWQPNGSFISETAKVSTHAHISPLVVIGPYAIIEPDVVVQRCVTIGAHVRVASASIIRPGATIGFRAQIERNVTVGAFCVLGSDLRLTRGSHLSDFATLSAARENFGEDESASVHPISTNANARAQIGRNTVLGLCSWVGEAVLASGVVIGYGGKVHDHSELGGSASVGFEAEVLGVCLGKRAQVGARELLRRSLGDHEALVPLRFEHDLIAS